MRKAATSPGIAGNDLNRCDAPALQHKIRANSKRTAVFFADSRLRVVGMGSGGWKRIALGGNKERFVRKKGFWFVKMGIFYGQREKACAKEVFVRKKAALSEVCKAFYKWKTFGLRKRTAFTAPAKLSDKEKTFFSAQRHRLRTAPKLTSSHKVYPRQPTVSLQYTFSFSKNNGLASALR